VNTPKVSPEGLEFLKLWEGCRLKIYLDASGYQTIGIGHLIVDSDPLEAWKKHGITEVQAISLLRDDVKFAADVVHNYTTQPLMQHQLDSLTSFVVNVGASAFWRSTLRKKLNADDHTALQEFPRWNKGRDPKTGKLRVLPGLTKRRKAESRLFNLGDYGHGP
jgi:lysozyme